MEVITKTKATVLIGVSGSANVFNEDIINQMCKNTEHPIIMPLSNPTSKAEGTPENIIKTSNGKAIIATGSPFEPVEYNNKTFAISQCNNSYIFPGLGLGVIAVGAKIVTDEMIMAASEALAENSPSIKDKQAALLPRLKTIRELSKKIALAVGLKAIEQNLAPQINKEELEKKIENQFWRPEYREYLRSAF